MCQHLYYDHLGDAFLFKLVAVSEHCAPASIGKRNSPTTPRC